MEEVASEGRTVLFVSHNLIAVEKLCDRAILLSGGRAIGAGKTRNVIEQYVSSVATEGAQRLDQRAERDGSGRLRFTGISFLNPENADQPVTGQALDILIDYEGRDSRPIPHPAFAISFSTGMGELILHCQSEAAGTALSSVPSSGVRLHLPRFALPAGRYSVNLFASVGGEVADWVQRAIEFDVVAGDFFGSGRRPAESHQTVLVEQAWSVEEPASRRSQEGVGATGSPS